MDDILKDCLDEEESKEYDFLVKRKQYLEEEQENKIIWKEISDLEEQAERAYREVTEWGYYLEALCSSDIEAYNRLNKLYKKVNHETYWRK